MSATQTDRSSASIAMREEMNRMRAQLFTLVESWGLPERRESACKQTIRTITYHAQTRLESVLKGVSDNGNHSS